MGATRMETEFEEAGPRPAGEDFPVGFGGPAPGTDGHPLSDDGMATDGPFPGTSISAGTAENKGEVGFLRFAFAKLAAEFAVCGVIFGGDQKSGRLTIETMNDPGPVRSASWGQLALAVVKEGSGEGSGRTSGAGVNMHAGGFVDDQQVGILVKNFKGNGFRSDIAGRRGGM